MIPITTEDRVLPQRQGHRPLRSVPAPELQPIPTGPMSSGSSKRKGRMLAAVSSTVPSAAYGNLGKPAKSYDVAEGDRIEVDGVIYEIHDDHNLADPRLVPVQ